MTAQLRPRLRKRPAPQTTASVSTPAPAGGILANAPAYGGEGNLQHAIWLYNLVPGEYGVRVRKGSLDYATTILDKDAAEGEIRTILDYVAPDGTTKKFAANNDGIWEITGGGTGTWTKVHDLATKGADTGYVSSIQYTTTGGVHYLLMCDEANGYITFDGTTWTAGSTTGVTAGNLVQIMEWRGRIWFVEKDSGDLWYLALLAIGGAATQFEMGTRMRKGGHVKQITTWTFDDAAGLDDKLVVLGEGGDVLVWSGDVGSTFQVEGRWYLGSLPKGRRAMSEWGGDVVILSHEGAVLMSTLTSGITGIRDDAYLTDNIARYFRDQMTVVRSEYGWGAELHPAAGLGVFSVPQQASQETIQFVIDTTTQAWCMFRGLDMKCMTDSDDGLFFGTADGKVMKYTGTVDNAAIDGSSSDPITFSGLTHYSDLGKPGQWKRGKFIRPLWLGGALPAYGIALRYDYDLAEVGGLPSATPGTIAVWDAGIWDSSTWGGSAQSFPILSGLTGMGRHVAIAVKGETSVELSLVGFDLMYDIGGLL